MKKAILIAAFVLSATPASAATIVVTDSPVARDLTISTSESNNNRTNNQSRQAEISNNQTQETNQQATGGNQDNQGVNIIPVNVAPGINAAVPIQTGPIEVLTNKSIEQKQSYEDNSRYENHESTQIDNSRGKATTSNQPVILLGSSQSLETRRVDHGSDNTRRVSLTKSGELPMTGVDVGRTLALALTLLTTGFGMTRVGRIEG